MQHYELVMRKKRMGANNFDNKRLLYKFLDKEDNTKSFAQFFVLKHFEPAQKMA